MKDVRFYLILPVLLAPSYITTGFFFHMAHLVESKGWSLKDFTEAYFLFTAVLGVVSLLLWVGVVLAGRWIAYTDYLYFLWE